MYYETFGSGTAKAIAFNMSQGDICYRALLEYLSFKELKILQKYPELCARIREIANMDVETLALTLEEDHNLEIDPYHSGDIWIDFEGLQEATPKWIDTEDPSVDGIFLREENFVGWARRFLLQEVRVNIWMKYIAYKTEMREHYALYGEGWGTYL